MIVVTGGIKSRMTRTKRTLNEDSIHLPISDAFERRVTHSQGMYPLPFHDHHSLCLSVERNLEGAMRNEDYARCVVNQALQANPPRWFWQGNRSWIIWFLDAFFPRSIWVRETENSLRNNLVVEIFFLAN